MPEITCLNYPMCAHVQPEVEWLLCLSVCQSVCQSDCGHKYVHFEQIRNTCSFFLQRSTNKRSFCPNYRTKLHLDFNISMV